MNNEIIQRSWESGDKKMEWVQSYMPVLNSIKDRFIKGSEIVVFIQ
jgi:S-adenosylhomocysteine hydrolase